MWTFFILGLAVAVAGIETDGEVESLPGYAGSLKQRTLAGLVSANRSSGSALYYILYESRNVARPRRTTPFVVWMNGGPGASSALGNFLGHGPYRIIADSKGIHGLTENPHAWNTEAHVMYVDQPGGTGYSHGPPPATLQQASWEFASFLENFFELHPEYSECPLILAGESFAGVFQPINTAHILTERPGLARRLRAVILGNPGIFDPIQYEGTIPFATSHGLIGNAQAQKAKEMYKECTQLLDAGENYKAFLACQGMSNWVIAQAGSPFVYDIRKWGDQFDLVMDPAEGAYCRNETVKKALHVAGRPWRDGDGTQTPNPVFNALKNQMLISITPYLETILNHNVPFILYNGVYDCSPCNHIGSYNYFGLLNRKGFNTAEREVWTIPGVDHPLGYWQSGDGLNFVWIANSGHMVPLDQPVACLNVLKRVIAEHAPADEITVIM